MTGFVPRSKRVWSLGNPDAPALSFNGVDEYGVEWIIADPRGWYASPPTELGLTDKGTHGAWFGRGAYKSRVLEVSGAFRVCGGSPALTDAAIEAAVDRLQDALDPTADTLLSVTETVPKQVTVRPSSEVDVHPVPGQNRARRFSVVLTCADPFKYAAGAAGLTTVTLRLLDPAAMPGMTHDVVHPLDHGGAGDALGWQANATNLGQMPAATVLRFTGPAVNPRLLNVTTGEFFTLGRNLAAGVEAVVDAELRTVLIGGSSDFGAKAARSTFLNLARGVNDLRFTADAYQAAARASVSWRPRWK